MMCRQRVARCATSPPPRPSPREDAIPPAAKKSRKKQKKTTPYVPSPEARPIARKLGSLAHAWAKQGGTLGVRQREQLRRAFAAAAESLEWSTIVAEPVEAAIEDVRRLAGAGTRSMVEELEEELDRKRSEIQRLEKLQSSIEKKGNASSFKGPLEISYTHTARSHGDLVTKTETLVLETREDCLEAAATIEKQLGGWKRLRETMIDELKQRRRQLEDTREHLPLFVDSSRGVLSEVFAVLY